MNRTRLAVLGAVALAAAGAAVADTAPAVADVSQSSPPASVAIRPTAIIHARGAELTVPITAVCSGVSSVYAQVDQQRAGVVVTGYDRLNFRCGSGQNKVKLHVQPYQLPFLPGTAHVRVTLYYGMGPGDPGTPLTAEADVAVVDG